MRSSIHDSGLLKGLQIKNHAKGAMEKSSQAPKPAMDKFCAMQPRLTPHLRR
ncbi:hypothetical protein [Pseudorhodoplanes sp.]|uniref:hypothetical protein n=1 Tax=Pseudorhodoplanes sp. TaxID=1934341 RepID=UPI003D15047D